MFTDMSMLIYYKLQKLSKFSSMSNILKIIFKQLYIIHLRGLFPHCLILTLKHSFQSFEHAVNNIDTSSQVSNILFPVLCNAETAIFSKSTWFIHNSYHLGFLRGLYILSELRSLKYETREIKN